jgi:flagellar hook-associated protein 1 FlgK
VSFTSSILNIAKSGLSAQQAVLAATSNNITNVNTEGYTRRRVDLRENSSQQVGLALGRGVNAEAVERLGDEFLEKVLRTAAGEQEYASVQEELLSRAQGMFGISGELTTIGSALEDFFGSLSDLTVSPADQELRVNVLNAANSLTTSINRSYQSLADLQREADDRMSAEIENLNQISEELVGLNLSIRQIESAGQVAAPERDRRDLLLKEMSEIVDIRVVEDNTSQILVYLPNGFNLVSAGQFNALEVSKAPSFLAGNAPPALDGGPLSFVVFDYDRGAGAEHIDLTKLIGQGTGRLSGLISVRGAHDPTNTNPFQATGQLVELASRVEAITRVLLTEFNQVYLGVDQANLRSNTGVATSPLNNDEDTTTPTIYDPSSGYLDSSGNPVAATMFGLFDVPLATDQALGTIQGLPDAGDINILQNSFNDFSSIIRVAITDKNQLANARDLDATDASLRLFPGDSSNIEELVKLRDQTFTNITVGNFTMNGTLSAVYQDTVSEIGNRVIAARSSRDIAKSTRLSAQAQRDSAAGVSLDEEFANLIRFQRAFEASARMISLADEMLQTVINLI